jgi:hypothetical protein
MQPIEDEVFKQISWDGWQDTRYAKKDRILQSNNRKSAWDVLPAQATYPVMFSNHQSSGVENIVDHTFPMPIVPLGLGEVDADKISHYGNNVFQQVHILWLTKYK